MHVFVIAPAPAPEISCIIKFLAEGVCKFASDPLGFLDMIRERTELRTDGVAPVRARGESGTRHTRQPERTGSPCSHDGMRDDVGIRNLDC